MSGFRLKLNRLRNIPYASSIQETLAFDQAFETEYAYEGKWNLVMVKPILVHSVVIFLVQFPEGDGSSMALVYNTRDEWSDIEKSQRVRPKRSAWRSKNTIQNVICFLLLHIF